MLQQAGPQCRYGERHNGKSHPGIFMHIMMFGTLLSMKCQKEKAEHVEGGKTAGNKADAKCHIMS
jgi:hypothetical protein